MRTRFTFTRMTGCCAGAGTTKSKPARELTSLDNRCMLVPFPFDPDLSVGEVLLLPDGNPALQSIDAFVRSFKGGFAVRRGDHDRDTGFSHQHAAEAMHHG